MENKNIALAKGYVESHLEIHDGSILIAINGSIIFRAANYQVALIQEEAQQAIMTPDNSTVFTIISDTQ